MIAKVTFEKTTDNRCPRVGVEHVPALAFAEGALLMHGGVGIVWMDLYGEVGIRIEYLDEQGELIAGKASEQLAVIAPESREGRPLEGTANDGTVARRMGRS